MKILNHNFRLRKTETSFGTFGYFLVELEDSDTKDVDVITQKTRESKKMAMKVIIESCPLCGKYDPVIELGDDSLFRFVCQSCHHQGVGMPSADEAIREWNRSARYYRNVSMEISEGLEIKKIMQCKKCGYTCFEEDWNGLFCPRCGGQQDKSDNGCGE